MEKETKHTPGDKTIQNNCRWFEGYGIMVPEAMVNTLLKENERLKERIDTDWYVVSLNEDVKRLQTELSEMKKDNDELVEALNKFLNYSSSNDRIVEVHEFALQVLSRIKIQ